MWSLFISFLAAPLPGWGGADWVPAAEAVLVWMASVFLPLFFFLLLALCRLLTVFFLLVALLLMGGQCVLNGVN